MKKLTKLNIAAFTVVALFIANNVKAQTMSTMSPNPWRFGIGLETGVPTGDLNKATMWELGGTARLQYSVSANFGIILTSGYYNFFHGTYSSPTTTIANNTYATTAHDQGIIPVKLGVKEFFSSNYYISAEGGVGFETQYNEDKKFILSPAIGWANTSWDVSARYENFAGQGNNYGLLGLRIAYGFKL